MAASDYIPMNFALISNPYNWVIVVGIVLMTGLGLALILPGTIEKVESN